MFEAKRWNESGFYYNMIKYYAAIAVIKVEDRVNAIRHFEELLKQITLKRRCLWNCFTNNIGAMVIR